MKNSAVRERARAYSWGESGFVDENNGFFSLPCIVVFVCLYFGFNERGAAARRVIMIFLWICQWLEEYV